MCFFVCLKKRRLCFRKKRPGVWGGEDPYPREGVGVSRALSFGRRGATGRVGVGGHSCRLAARGVGESSYSNTENKQKRRRFIFETRREVAPHTCLPVWSWSGARVAGRLSACVGVRSDPCTDCTRVSAVARRRVPELKKMSKMMLRRLAAKQPHPRVKRAAQKKIELEALKLSDFAHFLRDRR